LRMEGDEGIGVLVSRDLTGTPESVRLLGEALAAEVFTVRGTRLKGHGTSVEGLTRRAEIERSRLVRSSRASGCGCPGPRPPETHRLS
jgi:hypothetical protein